MRKIDQISRQLDPKEVGSSVRNKQGQRDSKYESGSTTPAQYEEAGFVRTVSKVRYYKTVRDVDDGFGNLIVSCRECVLSRTHFDSEAKLWIYKYTQIGPVLDVKVFCHHKVHGIEIQIPSTSGDNTEGWVVISRSSNRYVDESRYRDPEDLPDDIVQQSVRDQDNDHSQGERSDNPFLFHERISEDLTAKEISYQCKWEAQVSKFVIDLVRHENLRETGGAIHWNLTSPKLSFKLRSDGESNFSDRGCISTSSGKEATREYSSIARFSQQVAEHSSHSRTHRR